MYCDEPLSTAVSSSRGDTDLRAALAGLLADLRDEEASVLILYPADVPEVFVQCIVTDAGVRLEAVSNVFLGGSDRALDEGQTQLLEHLGWTAPNVPDLSEDRADDWLEEVSGPPNWWREVNGPDDVERSADLLLTTLVAVYRITGEAPLWVKAFPADCQEWEWTNEGLVALDV